MSQSIKSDHISESTVARIAGNLLSGDHQTLHRPDWHQKAAQDAVALARAIAAEVERTKAVEAGQAGLSRPEGTR